MTNSSLTVINTVLILFTYLSDTDPITNTPQSCNTDIFVGSENEASDYVDVTVMYTITTTLSRLQSLSNFYSSQYQSQQLFSMAILVQRSFSATPQYLYQF